MCAHGQLCAKMGVVKRAISQSIILGLLVKFDYLDLQEVSKKFSDFYSNLQIMSPLCALLTGLILHKPTILLSYLSIYLISRVCILPQCLSRYAKRDINVRRRIKPNDIKHSEKMAELKKIKSQT